MRFTGLFILFVAVNVQAQVHEAATPFVGMANVNSAFFSPWCVWSNQAGMARSTENYAGVSYRHLFGLKELSTKAVFAVHPTPWGAMGFSYEYFGYEYYHDQMIGLAWGKQLASFFDLGVKIDYLLSKVAKQSGVCQVFFFETGVIFSLPYSVFVGLHTYNPANIARLTAPEQVYVAEEYTVSVSWEIDRMFTLASQFDLTDRSAVFSGGVVFHYQDFLAVKCGFKTWYNNIYAGVGVRWDRYEADISYNTHPYLGNTVHICLGVKF